MSPSIYSVLKDKDNIFVVIVQTLLENEEEKRQRKYDTIVGKETIKEDIFMQKFTYCVPTEIIFGKDTERECGKMVKRHGGKKVLIVYGGGSVRHSGLLERVEHSLEEEGISHVECGGVTPNPRLSFAEMGSKERDRRGCRFYSGRGRRKHYRCGESHRSRDCESGCFALGYLDEERISYQNIKGWRRIDHLGSRKRDERLCRFDQ